ncbi:MAG: hypothetical protein ACTSYL_11780 [Candidatus Thorarchaeota archaeon]
MADYSGRLVLFFLAVIPIIAGSLIAITVLGSDVIGTIISNSRTYSVPELMVQALVSILLGSIVVASLFWIVKRRGTRRIVVAFVVSPLLGFISIFISETFLLVLFKGTTNAFAGFVLLLSLAVSMLAIALIIIDVIPPTIRNLFVAFYGSVFGAFLGITLVTSNIFVIIITVIIEDYFLTRHHPIGHREVMQDRIGSDPFDYARVQIKGSAVGAGDYVVYSLIASHTMIFFPPFVWAMAVILATIGIGVNAFVLVREDKPLPAIPLPAILSLFPLFVYMLFSLQFI